jgi:hypothetical protein
MFPFEINEQTKCYAVRLVACEIETLREQKYAPKEMRRVLGVLGIYRVRHVNTAGQFMARWVPDKRGVIHRRRSLKDSSSGSIQMYFSKVLAHLARDRASPPSSCLSNVPSAGGSIGW